MYQPAVNQVAGHEAGARSIGPPVDSTGKFYKPLQDSQRGEKERKFYEQFFADGTISESVKAYLPFFYGTKELEASDSSGPIKHMILEDLTQRYSRACVIDLKIGMHTWYSGASDSYIEKCKKKDAETTSSLLGFRVSGLQAYDSNYGNMWKPGRLWCKALDADSAKVAIKQFVSSNPADCANPDSFFASMVYCGPQGMVRQLTELRNWFEVQTRFHFYSTSILLMYESDYSGCGGNMSPSVKMVDFAHALTGQAARDENFLQGLDSLIKILQDIGK